MFTEDRWIVHADVYLEIFNWTRSIYFLSRTCDQFISLVLFIQKCLVLSVLNREK
jgi:hypothetical protein